MTGKMIEDYLLDVDGISAIVGSNIYPVHVIKADGAYVTYRKIAAGREYVYDGADGGHPTYEISAFAPTFAVARDLADKIIVALEVWPAEAPDEVDSASIIDEEELFNHNVGDSGLYQVLFRCEIWPNDEE